MIGVFTNHLWQSTLFGIAAGLFTLMFRRNPAHVRYWLWFSASVKFFVPFSLLMSVGSHLPWAPAAKLAAPIAPTSIPLTALQTTQRFSGTLPLAPSNTSAHEWIPVAIAGIWACGFAATVLTRFRAWRRVRAAVRSSSPIDLLTSVDVRSCPGLLEPGVVGFFHPILLVPEGIAERLTPPQLRSVLAHELCHVRRHDNFFASIHMITEAAFWFHPLVWWIGARLVDERERACDEQVLHLGCTPQDYAEGILNVCRLYVESPLICVSGVTGSNLEKRIEEIMSNRTLADLNFAGKVALGLAATAALAVPIAIGVMNAPAIRAQSEPVPKFESSSVRPCTNGPGMKRGAGYSSSPGAVNTGCMPLVDASNLGLIQRAYVRFAGGHAHWPGVAPIEGGPAWIRSALYEISAKSTENPRQEMMEGPMMQAILEDRFKLKIHRETREVPVYVLTAADGESHLKPFMEGSCIPMPLNPPAPPLPPGQQFCKVRIGIQPPSVDAQGSTLAEFSQLLDSVLDRPVIDKTGITRKFDIHLEFGIDANTPKFLPGGELARFVSAPAGSAAPSILTAIQQLGLKLEPANGPREFLVIDHIEAPVQN